MTTSNGSLGFATLLIAGAVASGACGLATTPDSGPSSASSAASTGEGASSANGGGHAGGAGGSGTGGGQGGSGGGTGGTGGAGGSTNLCGNGVIDPNEECDGGMSGAVGCDASCHVVCNAQYEILDPTSHHCYFLTDTTTQVHWDEARTYCQAWGGDLVIFDTLAEFNFLYPSVPVNGSGSDRHWLGGGDQAAEGVYLWIDGSPVSYPFSTPPWANGQPDGTNSDDCLVLNQAIGGMGDYDCGSPGHPFCERAPPGN